jgi:hypothetical protein
MEQTSRWADDDGAEETIRPSQSEIKERLDRTWNSLMEVLKENPEKAIKNFIEYSKCASIRRFSILNQFFLYAQSDGNARFVLTEKAWERLGRKVKEGEKPFRVFVVLPIYKRNRRGRRTQLSSYVYMEHEEYDISQTEGDYIQAPVVTAEAPHAAHLLHSLEHYCFRHRIELTDQPITSGTRSPEELMTLATALGSTDGSRIYVKQDMSDTRKARVLAHEIAHIHMHLDLCIDSRFIEPGDGKPPVKTAQWEVEAEAVACLVCAAWGIDTTEESKYYLMLFKEKDIQVGQVSERVLLTVRRILNSVHPYIDYR